MQIHAIVVVRLRPSAFAHDVRARFKRGDAIAAPSPLQALMRLDKFLKVSRLAKRRAEAKDGIDAGRITKDGHALKPGYVVKVGDVLVIHYRAKFLTVRVREVPERVLPSLKPAELYEILEDRKDDARSWA